MPHFPKTRGCQFFLKVLKNSYKILRVPFVGGTVIRTSRKGQETSDSLDSNGPGEEEGEGK
jgi:hypothetical protein